MSNHTNIQIVERWNFCDGLIYHPQQQNFAITAMFISLYCEILEGHWMWKVINLQYFIVNSIQNPAQHQCYTSHSGSQLQYQCNLGPCNTIQYNEITFQTVQLYIIPWMSEHTHDFCNFFWSECRLSTFSLFKSMIKLWIFFHYPTRYYSTTRFLSSLPYPTLPESEKALPFRAC